MKSVLILLVALPLVFAGAEMEYAALRATSAGSNMVLDEAIIAEVNNGKNTWTAGVNEKFVGMTVADAQKMLGLVEDVQVTSLKTVIRAESALPDSFDSREKWAGCVGHIRNQGQCGSCWSFGSSEALADRFCIATNGKTKVVLSPEYQVACDKMNMACRGGNLQYAWRFLEQTGTVSDNCLPYTSGEAGVVPTCPSTCSDRSEPFTHYKAKSIVAPASEADMMAEIYKNGPIEAGFIVYKDFMAYKGGVYQHVSGPQMGGHAIKIVGWGEEQGVKYWTVANSWGETWGEDGFFKIARGTGECQIESNAIAGEADV